MSMMAGFPPQGGMPQHPGMHPGQPMGVPGGPHPQSMGGPMQMHPGVSGPHIGGGQQVSQAPNMMMQPGMGIPQGGGGPSAHAMSHLAPNAQQMMHAQAAQQAGMGQPGMQPHMMNLNPQQQRMMWQRQAMQRQAAAMQQGQMGHPGQQAAQQGGFNPQQIAAMQASGQLGNLPPHMQQQMASAQLMHQQQAAAMEAARQQQHMNQQNLAAQQANHLAMQQAHSQGSNQGGQPNVNVSQPHPNQPPMRPASAMAGTTGMEARPSPAPTAGPQPGQGPQQAPQVSQPPNQPNQQPQTSGPQGPQAQNAPAQGPQPNQGQNPAQQAGNGQGQPQGQNRVPGQPGQQQGPPMNPQQMQAAQAAAMARNQQMQAAQAAQARATQGQSLLQALNFANKLGSFRSDQQQNSIAHWTQFVQQHFTDDAIYRMVLKFESDSSSKTFEVQAAGLPRYLYIQFESDIEQVQLLLDGNFEKKLSDTHTVVRADRAKFLHWFKDGTQLVWNGTFQVMYNGDKIENFSFENREHQTYYPRSKLVELCAAAAVGGSPNQNRSPKMTKNQRKMQGQNQGQGAGGGDGQSFDMRRLPQTQITQFGIHKSLQTQLELAETMNAMTPLISFSRDHPELSVPQALHRLVESYATQQTAAQQQAASAAMTPQMQAAQGVQGGLPNPGASGGPVQGAFPPGGVQGPGVPRPGMPNPQMMNAMGQSPALSNSGLPPGVGVVMNGAGGGATPSPHQSNMAPPMQPSMSQTSHGSGATGTSPGMGQGQGSKRRRSTAAGMKEDGEGKVKASPRMGGGGKRAKGS